MIICICRNINDKKVSSAIENGAKSPAQIMAKCGTRFNCGSCMTTMHEMLPKQENCGKIDIKEIAAE